MTGQMGFWSITDRFAEISAQDNSLETLAAMVDCEMFRPVLQVVPSRRSRPKVGAETPRERVVLDPGECCPDYGWELRLVD